MFFPKPILPNRLDEPPSLSQLSTTDGTASIALAAKLYSARGESAEFYLIRGLEYIRKGQPDRAISDYNKALEINPRYTQAYYNRGLAYIRKGHLDRAIADFNKAIEINPRFAKAYCNRGAAYALKGQYDRAIADLTKALEINPRDALAYYNRAKCYYHQKDYDNAWKDVKICQRMGTRFPPQFIEDLRKASGRYR